MWIVRLKKSNNTSEMAHWMKLCFWELGFATTLAKKKGWATVKCFIFVILRIEFTVEFRHFLKMFFEIAKNLK